MSLATQELAGGEIAETLLDAISATLGPFVLLDTSYPRAVLAPEAIAVLRLPRAELERDFLLRFRQAGGHQPIVAVEPASEGFVWPPAQFQRSDRPRAIVVAFDDPADAADIGPAFLDQGSALLVPTGDGLEALVAAFGDKRVRRLRPQGGGPVLALVLPSGAARDAGGSSADIAFRAYAPAGAVEAHHLIHDGGYASEGDAKYSWLWTGPSSHFRMVVPRALAAPPRLVEICVARTEEPANLDRLAVQLNGRPTPFELDRWSDSSGKVRVALPPAADSAVLTLIIPQMRADENSGRLLGLCIDKVILSP